MNIVRGRMPTVVPEPSIREHWVTMEEKTNDGHI